MDQNVRKSQTLKDTVITIEQTNERKLNNGLLNPSTSKKKKSFFKTKTHTLSYVNVFKSLINFIKVIYTSLEYLVRMFTPKYI